MQERGREDLMERGAGQMACGQDQMGSGPDHGICGSDCGSEHGSSHRIACGLVPREMIQGFIDTQVTGRGLDGRTEKAYRLDLEHFYRWLEERRRSGAGEDGAGSACPGAEEERSSKGAGCFGEEQERPGSGLDGQAWDEAMEAYLEHLLHGKGLRPSTVNRKQRVLGYYLSYLVKEGALSESREFEKVRTESRSLPPAAVPPGAEQQEKEGLGAERREEKNLGAGTISSRGLLSKKEVDLFFRAIEREYEDLDSSFRKRVCLRDLVMMELLFYHGIEVSELLRMEVSDYDRKTGMLFVRRKRDRSYCIHLFSQGLRERMGMWLEERGYFERDEAYRDRMFLSKLGRPLSMKMAIMIFDKYREMAGIRAGFTPKDLKRSMKRYARELLMEWCG